VQNPEAILQEIGLKTGQTLVDVGCGEGFFALPAARLTGPEGKVYGVDLDSSAIKELKTKASKEDLSNLELKAGPAEGRDPVSGLRRYRIHGNCTARLPKPGPSIGERPKDGQTGRQVG